MSDLELTPREREYVARLKQDQAKQAASLTLRESTPEQTADILHLSKKTGIPTAAVQTDPAKVRQQIQREELSRLASESPLLSQWIGRDQNYDISKDDLPTLAKVESAIQPTGMRVGLEGVGTPTDPYRTPSYLPKVDAYADAPVGSWVKMPDGSLRKRETRWFENFYTLPFRVGEIVGNANKLPNTVAKAALPKALEPLATLMPGNTALDEEARDWFSGNRQLAETMFPQNTSLQDVKDSDTLPEALLRGLQFGASASARSAGDMIAAPLAYGAPYIAARTEEISKARAANDGKESPELKDLAIAATAAFIEGRLESLATGRLLGPSQGLGLGSVAREAGIQIGTEAVEEGAAYLGETAGTQVGATAEGLGDSILGGVLAGGAMAGPVMVKDAFRALDQRASTLLRRGLEAAEAKTEQEAIAAIAETIEATKLKKLSPEKLEEVLSEFTDRNVYLTAEDALVLYQSDDKPARDLLGDEFDESLASGKEVEVPLSRYLVKVGKEGHAVLGGKIRLKPGQDVKADVEMPSKEDIEASISEAYESAQADSANDGSGVYDAFYGQLIGRFDKATAEQYASLGQAFYRTLGAKSGRSPMELMQRYRINLGAVIERRQERERFDAAVDPVLDALRSGRVFSKGEVNGQRLTTAIIAKGGIRSDAFGAGDLKAQDARLARPGLFRNTGMTLDEALQVAKELGFVNETNTEREGQYDPDGADVSTLTELLIEDMKGEGVYNLSGFNANRASFNEAVQSMGELLDARGVDLKNTSNAEIKRMLNGDDAGVVYDGEPEQTLDQPANIRRKVYGENLLLAGFSMLAQDDAAFQLPTSDKTDIYQLVAEVEPGASILNADDLINSGSNPDQAWRIKIGESEGEIYQKGKTVWIDVSKFKEGDGGRRVYNIAANYAYNTGKVFIGDPAGLSLKAQQRRLENMISSALKFSTTKHLYPHERQFESHAGVPALKWKIGDDAYNLNGMLLASLDVMEKQFPEIGELYYDGVHDEIKEIATDEQRGVDYLDALAGRRRDEVEAGTQGGRVEASVITGGSTSIARAVLARTLLRGTGEQKSAILDRLGNERSSRLVGTLYQDSPAESGASSLPEKTPRGQVAIVRNADGSMDFNISVFEKADYSTFLHESAHAYLEIMRDMALQPDADASLKADWSTIKTYLGMKDDVLSVDQHETFARSFEAYLREGKAPSRSLRKVFAAFRVWLLRIYRTLTGLRVELNDDIRGVFDRMLATEAEIKEARETYSLGGLFTDAKALGMTGEQAMQYERLVEETAEEGEARLGAEVLRSEHRARQAWFKQEARKEEAEIAADLSRRPDFVAKEILRTGKFGDGTEAPEMLRVKLDRADLLDRVGPESMKRFRGLYSKDGGVSLQEAALLFGYDSPNTLLDAIQNAGDFQAVVKSEAKARMAIRYPDMMENGTLPAEAVRIVHSDRQADLLLREVNLLERREGRRPTVLQQVRDAAADIIEGKTVRGLRPDSFLHAEKTAGRKAFEAAAKGDWTQARVQRLRQLLNLELYRAARDGQERAETMHKYLRRYTETKARAKVGKENEALLNEIDALLAPVDWRASATKYGARGVHWKDLKLDNLTATYEEVKSLVYRARDEGKLRLGMELVDKTFVSEAMVASVTGNNKPKPRVYGLKTPAQIAADEAQDIRVRLAAPTDLARGLDGYTDGGAVHRHVIDVIHGANQEAQQAIQKAQDEEAKLYLKHYTKKEIRRIAVERINTGIPGIKTKEQILGLALNWGNEGNREAVLTQVNNRLTEAQVVQLLGTLDARDWAFVQEAWDMIAQHGPALLDAAQRRTGIRPKMVTPKGFTVTSADGKEITLRGGYYPLKYEYDGQKASKGRVSEVEEAYDKLLNGGHVRAATKAGASIDRVGSAGQTVRLDLGVLSQHQNEVLRDIHLGDAVRYVHSVLHDGEFVKAADSVGLLANVDALKLWLKDVAVGELLPSSRWQRLLRGIRTNFTAAALTYKPVSAALQVTGVVQSSVVLGRTNMLHGIKEFASHPKKLAEYVDGQSSFMRERAKTHVEAVNEVMSARNHPALSARAKMIQHGYYMIGRIQRTVDLATWAAAEKKGTELFGNDRAKVIAYADDAVKRAQASQDFIDKNALQRGTTGVDNRQSEFIRAFTPLMSYMMAKNNILIEKTALARKGGTAKDYAGLAVDYANLFVVEALLVTVLRGQWPDDEDEDGFFDELFAMAATEGLVGPMGGVPGISSLASVIRGFTPRGYTDSMWASLGKLYSESEEAITEGEVDYGTARAVVTTAGFAAGVPSSQINATIKAMEAADNGEDVPWWRYVTGPERK